MSSIELERPTEYSRWRHHSGRIYTVMFIANTHSDKPNYPETVVYYGENQRIWTGPLSDWHRRMTKLEDEEQSNEDQYTGR